MPTNNAWNSSNPAQIAKGGTGRSSVDSYRVVCGGSLDSNPLQTVVNSGTPGQVLVSKGSSSLPIWCGSSFNPASTTFIYTGGGTSQTGGGVIARFNTYGGPILDPGNNYDSATNNYIVPRDGVYFFCITSIYLGSTGSSLVAHHNANSYLLKNNTIVNESINYMNIGVMCLGTGPSDYTGANSSTSLLMQCVKNDKITAAAVVNDGATDVYLNISFFGFKL
jgi:hypothetical protein